MCYACNISCCHTMSTSKTLNFHVQLFFIQYFSFLVAIVSSAKGFLRNKTSTTIAYLDRIHKHKTHCTGICPWNRGSASTEPVSDIGFSASDAGHLVYAPRLYQRLQ